MMDVFTVRNEVFNAIQDVLERNAIVPDKRLTWLTQKIGRKKSFRIFVDCLKFYDRVEFQLTLEFWIYEVEAIWEKVKELRGEPYYGGPTFTLAEGEFYHLLQNEIPKFQTSFYHIAYDAQSLNDEVELCREILVNEIEPYFSIYSNLERFQEHIVKSDYHVKGPKFVLPGLVAMKLYGECEFEKFVESVCKLYNYFVDPRDLYVFQYIEHIRHI